MTNKITAGLIASEGAIQNELIQLLLSHPLVHLKIIASKTLKKQKLCNVQGRFRGQSDLVYENINVNKIGKACQVVFVCLPDLESLSLIKDLRNMGVHVINLSNDFRFADSKIFETQIGKHSQKLLAKKEAVYGLCEIDKHDIKKSCLVNLPSSFATSFLLALSPLVQNQMIVTSHIICDSKTAGHELSSGFDQMNQNAFAFGLQGHPARFEMQERLARLAFGDDVKIAFTPHILPLERGTLSTIYVKPMRKWKEAQILSVLKRFYKSSPFVQILEPHESPKIHDVIGTNHCHISAHYDEQSEHLVLISALDSLMKGSAGQAIQCMNLMMGWDEFTGLV